MSDKQRMGWQFVGDEGDFRLVSPQKNTDLYFPLVNEAGMMSNISPLLHGNATSGHNAFLTAPITNFDLHNSRASRNFWFYIQGKGAWSAAGQSAAQIAEVYGAEDVSVEAGLLWHKLIRANSEIGIRTEVTSFVPMTADQVELMRVEVKNIGAAPLQLTPTSAIPLYARSADDLRDHRHVTSLLHRTYSTEYGVEVQPSLSFDERGHRVNKMAYGVVGAEGNGNAPIGFFPCTEEFIGEGGTLDWPLTVVHNLAPRSLAGSQEEGYEAIGALRFENVTLQPGESSSYILAMGIGQDRLNQMHWVNTYLTESRFNTQLDECRSFWKSKIDTVSFQTGDPNFDRWMKWVTLQPILRRLYGNSFMPHHDYGRGGRGWRDLWQDCLALLLMEPSDVRSLLHNNYAGVRIDGSNATIIGSAPGEFIADRNNIPRVWMDHGAWPFLTTLLYINQSGDLDFLFQEQSYFKDVFVNRCKDRDESWSAMEGNKLKTKNGSDYSGTILEHILLQNLTPFYHVGEHNNILLEGADWNDGMDLGTKKGESVAFTAFYASNLAELSQLLIRTAERTGRKNIELAEEMTILLDTQNSGVDYESTDSKHALLEAYYAKVRTTVSGVKATLDIRKVAADLAAKAEWLFDHLRKNEWIQSAEGLEWYNGYYNNDGERVEGDHPNGVRMTLTGQVFAVMGGVATDDQVGRISEAVNRYLRDPKVGYRLNTQFGGIQQNLGRAFGFAFGHKENGAMFSHMTVMYGNALYKRGFVKEGREVLDSIYRLCLDFEKSRIYPGIPEYINEKGRGMYHYLTGSASWLLLTTVTEVFGVKGNLGDLALQPKLTNEQFDSEGKASIVTLFADKSLRISYDLVNQDRSAPYHVNSVKLNGSPIPAADLPGGCLINRNVIKELSDNQTHLIEVELA